MVPVGYLKSKWNDAKHKAIAQDIFEKAVAYLSVKTGYKYWQLHKTTTVFFFL